MYVERVPLESRINIMAVLATPNLYGSAIVDEYASQRSVGGFLFPSHQADLVKLCVAGGCGVAVERQDVHVRQCRMRHLCVPRHL